jgi:hypothetical protein
MQAPIQLRLFGPRGRLALLNYYSNEDYNQLKTNILDKLDLSLDDDDGFDFFYRDEDDVDFPLEKCFDALQNKNKIVVAEKPSLSQTMPPAGQPQKKVCW